MTTNEHVYAIYCRPEVDDDDVISVPNIKESKTILIVNFEVVSSSSF